MQPFDPPFESPIEYTFAWTVSKYLHPHVSWEKQVSKSTLCGQFRIDFEATLPSGYRIAFECDGADFHELALDEFRDAILLGDDKADSVVRFAGQDIYYRMDDVVYIISRIFPEMFTERSSQIITRLASPIVLSYLAIDDEVIRVSYPANDATPSGSALRAYHRQRAILPGRIQHWRHLYRYAKSRGGGRIDQLLQEILSQGLGKE